MRIGNPVFCLAVKPIRKSLTEGLSYVQYQEDRRLKPGSNSFQNRYNRRGSPS